VTPGGVSPPLARGAQIVGREVWAKMTTQIQGYLRAMVGRREANERVGPFLAAYDLHSDNPYRNYAIPDDGAEPTQADVQALIAAFERRLRTPRLEYAPAVAPAVEGALLAAGFVVEGHYPLMIVTRETTRELPEPSGIELLLATSDEEFLGVATVQNIAYEEPGAPTEHDVARLRGTVEGGGMVALARDAATGRPVGTGLCSTPIDGVTEVAAIGVVPDYRRRGVAGAVTALLVRAAFATGVTLPFLMPATEDGMRIYMRAGFERVSEIVMISRPRTDLGEGR
jgi:GNAT superfamily N-acetyltransferase